MAHYPAFISSNYSYVRTLPLILLLVALSNATCQTTRTGASAKQTKALDEALALSRAGETDKALAATEKLLKKNPDFVDAWLLKANLHTDKQAWAQAEAAYEKAYQLKPDYFPQLLRLLAETEWHQDKYAECAAHARQFLRTPAANTTTQQVKDPALRLAENAEFAEGAIKKPVKLEHERLSDAVNSPDPEYLPSLTADGRFLLFTRREQGRDENYWLSEWSTDGWRPARPVDELNTTNLEGAASLSADGQFLVFSSEDRPNLRGEGGFDIWYTTTKGAGRYGAVQRFGQGINSSAWDAQPCLSADGNELFFASSRPGGKGGKDLWVSKKNGDKFGVPVPLADLNTPFNEQVPFLHPDGQTLYFTSDGWPGMGNQDIFFSRRQADGTWSKPTNLGYPINTKDDEGALFVLPDGTTGYYAVRAAGSRNHDLYRLNIPVEARPIPTTWVAGRVLDATTGKRLKTAIKIVDLATQASYPISEGPDGFLVCLPTGRSYGFYAEKEGYLFYSQHYNLLDTASATRPYKVEIALTPVPKASEPTKGAVIVLNNLLFDTGSAQLRPESEAEVSAVLKLLQTYPDLRIKINGHTDNTGTAEANQKLSEARAKALFDVLIKRGIASSRMKVQGYGDTKPVASNDTPQGRALNRRTEIEIL